MPMRYDPDTGVPYFQPEAAIEIDEGVTPVPDVITSKSAIFAGDGPITAAYRKAQAKAAKDKPAEVQTPVDLQAAIDAAQPGDLARRIASDEEVDALAEALTSGALRWPVLVGLINRLRRAEAK